MTALPSPRTYGEATRRHRRRCQQLVTLSRDPTLSDFRKAYWGELARHGLRLLAELESEPPDAPYAGRLTALECAEPSCTTTVWELAGVVWAAAREGRQVERRCPEHAPQVSPASRPPPASAAELDELAEIAVGRLLALMPTLFGEDWSSPRIVALHDVGELERMIHRWRTNLWLLELNAGGRPAAIARLRHAADEAGLLHLLDVAPEPEPVIAAGAPPLVEPPPPESLRSDHESDGEDPPDGSPGDLPSGEPLDDEPEGGSEPEPWIF